MESQERYWHQCSCRPSLSHPEADTLLQRTLTTLALLALVLLVNTVPMVIAHGYILFATLSAACGALGLFACVKRGVEARDPGCLYFHLCGWWACLALLLSAFGAALTYTIPLLPRGPSPCCTPCLDHCAEVARPGVSRPTTDLVENCSRKQNFTLACAGNCRSHCDDVEGLQLGDRVSIISVDRDNQAVYEGREGYVVAEDPDDPNEYTVRFPDTGGVMSFTSNNLALARASVGDSVKVVRASPTLVSRVGYIQEDIGGEWPYQVKFPDGHTAMVGELDVFLSKDDFWCWTPPSDAHTAVPDIWRPACAADVRASFDEVKFHIDQGCGDYAIAWLEDGWVTGVAHGYELTEAEASERKGSVLWVKKRRRSQSFLLMAMSLFSTVLLCWALALAFCGCFWARRFQSFVDKHGFDIDIGAKPVLHRSIHRAHFDVQSCGATANNVTTCTVGSTVLVRSKSGGVVQSTSTMSNTDFKRRPVVVEASQRPMAYRPMANRPDQPRPALDGPRAQASPRPNPPQLLHNGQPIASRTSPRAHVEHGEAPSCPAPRGPRERMGRPVPSPITV